MKKQQVQTDSFDFWIQEFSCYLKKKNLSDNTEAAYRLALEHYFREHTEFSVEELQRHREQMIEQYMPSTVNQRIHSLNHFLRFWEDTAPEQFPELTGFRLKTVKCPRASFQDTVISNEDCQKLQTRLKANRKYFWYFVVRFLVTTGVRVSELTRIKVEHLSVGYLDLYSKGGKIRRIYITDTLCAETLEWCRKRKRTSGFLFSHTNGRPITARGVHERLHHFAILYGINPATTYPHSFRHRFAKNFLSRCGDIALLADLMGHESIETTRIYLTKSTKEQQEIMDEIVVW